MPNIRNLALIKRFSDYFRLKANDFLDSNASNIIIPTVNLPLPPDIRQIIDVAVNDSDKTIAVPSGKQWKVLYGFLILTTTVTAGNRVVEVRVQDENANILWLTSATNVQIASTTEFYSLQTGGDEPTEHTGGVHIINLPRELILTSEFALRVFDNAAVDPGADDLVVRLVVEETDLTSE